MTNEYAELKNELTELTARLARSEMALADTKRQMKQATRRARIAGSVAFAMLMGTMLLVSRPAAMAQAGVTLSSLLARVVALETKTAALSQTGTPGTASAKLTITGDNVQIVDGSGRTDDGTQGEVSGAKLTGLGNLIIGYNHTGNDSVDGDVRTGSHNLILGDYSDYASFGGFVAGVDNSSFAPYASVTGGDGNVANNYYSTVSGGEDNFANGYVSSVSGGYGNKANNYFATVSGGYNNTASGTESSVSGGISNTASGTESSVSGGSSNKASGLYSSVIGGESNTASNGADVVSGGTGNLASGGGASVTGGFNNTASANSSSVSGGEVVTQSSQYGWSGGGYHTP